MNKRFSALITPEIRSGKGFGLLNKAGFRRPGVPLVLFLPWKNGISANRILNFEDKPCLDNG